MQTEYEARFLAVDVNHLTKELQERGAVLHQPRTLMHRVIFENDDIVDRGGWLRLRDEGRRITLTYKQAATGASAIDSIREAEVVVGDFGDTYRMLVAMGFRARQEQENFREEWRLGELRFDFDTWPGLETFVEIEGPDQAAVEAAAEMLGLGMAIASYGSVDEVYMRVLGRNILAESSLTFQSHARFVWHGGEPVPEGMSITQVYVWAFDAEDGRVLIQDRGADHPSSRYMLPGGRPEESDGGDPLATARREALEESQVHIDTDRTVYLGYQVVVGDAGRPEPYAQLRYAAAIVGYEPIGPDLDTVDLRVNRRLMTSLERAVELLGWAERGAAQAEAARRGGIELGIPVESPAPEGYRDEGGD